MSLSATSRAKAKRAPAKAAVRQRAPTTIPIDPAFTENVPDDALDTPSSVPSAISGPSATPPEVEGHGEAHPPQPLSDFVRPRAEVVDPGFAMSDDEAVPPQFLRPPHPNPDPSQPNRPPGYPVPTFEPATASAAVAPRPPGTVRYEHRIRVLEAFHYEGSMTQAPGWVDRNWIAYGDYDEKRNLPAGPALNVPTPRTPQGFTLCRKGDYIVRQEIMLATGVAPAVQVEVWEKDEFERLFIPVNVTAVDPFDPGIHDHSSKEDAA